MTSTDKPKVCILRMEGTNNELEAYEAFESVGLEPVYVHLNELKSNHYRLEEFDIIFIPGGFSAGDYVRAGILFASRLKSIAFRELLKFVDEGKPVIGICNGFQVLAEIGLLPSTVKISRDLVLSHNDSNLYECRYTYVKFSSSNPILGAMGRLRDRYVIPVAHAEGKIVIRGGDRSIENLEENGQIVMQYCNDKGELEGYPWNPNGSAKNIAGISNESGNVIGIMPHPERMADPNITYYGYKQTTPVGLHFFNSLKEYIITNIHG
ncbi:MAG: phosphoribosylformylglycinamidine synthase subunit PurQ [Thermoplasmataceae archaeon]